MPNLNFQQFANGQVLAGLDSTGVVSENQYDLEDINDITVADDQAIGGVMVTILSAPAQATIVGTEGMEIQVRTAAGGALTSLYEILGAISVLPARVVTGAQFFVPIYSDKCQAKLGCWFKAISTSFVGNISVDADFQKEPVCKNESLQRVRT